MKDSDREERIERFMRKLSYLPLITTAAALVCSGVAEHRHRKHVDEEISRAYRIEYESCAVPGGLESAEKAFRKAKKSGDLRAARLFGRAISEMDFDRPSRARQCQIISKMKRLRR